MYFHLFKNLKYGYNMKPSWTILNIHMSKTDRILEETFWTLLKLISWWSTTTATLPIDVLTCLSPLIYVYWWKFVLKLIKFLYFWIVLHWALNEYLLILLLYFFDHFDFIIGLICCWLKALLFVFMVFLLFLFSGWKFVRDLINFNVNLL